MNLTVVHDQLRGVWGGRGLVREVLNWYIVDLERKDVFLSIEIDGELPIHVVVLDVYRVYRWVVKAPALHVLRIFTDCDDDCLSLRVILRLHDNARDAVQEEPQ